MYTRVIVAGWNLCSASNGLGLVTINSCYFRFRQYEDDVDPGRNIGTSIMTLHEAIAKLGDVDIWILRIKGFSYGINNRKWLLDGNDVSIIVCKDCTGEEINARRLDVAGRGDRYWRGERWLLRESV